VSSKRRSHGEGGIDSRGENVHRLQPLSKGQFDPVTLGKSNARGYAEIKPMLIKHTPGGDNMEGKR
jgi:hypothetical protein